MKMLTWKVLNILLWVVHLTWGFWSYAILHLVLGINLLIAAVIIIGVYGIIVVIFRGCPFTYIHQWFEIRMGTREKIAYAFYQCMLYKYFLRPVSTVFRLIRQ